MSPSSYTIETELFPRDALMFYSLHNLDQLDEKVFLTEILVLDLRAWFIVLIMFKVVPVANSSFD